MEISRTEGYYGGYGAWATANQTATAKAKSVQATENAKENSEDDYFNSLAKLVPSADVRLGNTFASDKTGKTLTLDPRLLEKMQKDPNFESKMKGMIKGVETAMNIMSSISKATGFTCVYKHSYIDENGHYRSTAVYKNDRMLKLSEKLRAERKEATEKLLASSKEKIAKKQEALKDKLAKRLEEKLEEQKAEKVENAAEVSPQEKVKETSEDKTPILEEGIVYFDDEEIPALAAANKRKETDSPVGAALDLTV